MVDSDVVALIRATGGSWMGNQVNLRMGTLMVH